MKQVLLIVLFFYSLHDVYSSNGIKPNACVQAFIPYIKLFLSTEDARLEQALLALRDPPPLNLSLGPNVSQQMQSFDPIGEALMDLATKPPQNIFVQGNIDRIYRLNPLSSWILIIVILRASLQESNSLYLQHRWAEEDLEDKEDLEERKIAIDRILNGSLQGRGVIHNPYIDSLVLRNNFGLYIDPQYQSNLTLHIRSQQTIQGIVSYKEGDARVWNDGFSLENAYIFFETNRRVYVFQVNPSNHLSANALVFEKKPERKTIAGNLYLEYFREIRAYFQLSDSFPESEMETQEMIELILDHLTITSRTSTYYLDRLIERLQDVQNTFHLSSTHPVSSVVIAYKQKGQRNFQISTILKIAYHLGLTLDILLSDKGLKPYVRLDSGKPPLSRDYIFEFERMVREELRISIQESNLSLAEIASQSGVSKNTIDLLTTSWTPQYVTLRDLMDVLRRDANRFLVNIANKVSQQVSPQFIIEDQEETYLQVFIGMRIRRAMSLCEFPFLKTKIKEILGIKMSKLEQIDPKLQTLLRTSFTTHIPLSLLVSEEPLEGHIHPDKIRRLEDMPGGYIEKAKQLIVYYVQRRMVELNWSLNDLASYSGFRETTLQMWFDHKQYPKYSSLVKLAGTLGKNLPEFLQNLETDIARFESMDLHIELPEPSRSMSITQSVSNEFQRWRERIIQALELTNITSRILRDRFHLDLNRLKSPSNQFELEKVFKAAHVVGISEERLLGHDDLSQIVDPNRHQKNIQPISEQSVREKMRYLILNIQDQNVEESRLEPASRVRLRSIVTYRSPYVPAIYVIQLAEDLNVEKPAPLFRRRVSFRR